MKRLQNNHHLKSLFFVVGSASSICSFYLVVNDLFFSPVKRDLTVLLATIFWIITLKALHLKSTVTFSILFLLISLVGYELYLDPLSGITKRIFVWIYIIMVVGTVQGLWELRKKQ